MLSKFGSTILLAFVAQAQTFSAPVAALPSNGVFELSAIPALPPDPTPPTLRKHEVYGPWLGFVVVTIRNVSGRVVRLSEVDPMWEFDAEVVDATGHAATRTDLGKKWADPKRKITGLVSVSQVQLVPLEEFTIRLDMSRIFQIEPSHAYKVTLRRSWGLPKTDEAGKPLQQVEISSSFEVPEVGILR